MKLEFEQIWGRAVQGNVPDSKESWTFSVFESNSAVQTPVSAAPMWSWLAGDKQPPNVVIHRAINDEIVSTDDLKTCIANFRFNQILAQFVTFGLRLARFRGAGSWTSIDDDQMRARFQRFGQVAQDRLWLC